MKFLSQKRYDHLVLERDVAEHSAEDLKFQVKELEKQVKDLKELKEEDLFEYNPANPTLIIKLGDPSKGWIPEVGHKNELQRRLKKCHLDKRYNIIIWNYAIHVEKV